jgi:MFS transporter, ACS family, D-galactonate transporter
MHRVPGEPTLTEDIQLRTDSRHRWRIAILLGVGVLVNYLDRINLSVSEAPLHDEFGISKITFGFLLGTYSWTYALLQMPMGVLLDRFGVKLIGRAAALLWSFASFAAAFAGGLVGLFSARLLLGIGESPTFPANAKATGYWFPVSERGLATALFDAAAYLGSGLGAPVVGILLLKWGWRLSFGFTGIVSLIYFLAFWAFYRDPGEDRKLTFSERNYLTAGGARIQQSVSHTKGASIWSLLHNRKVLGLAIGAASYNYTFYLLLSWLPSYLSSTMHIGVLHTVAYTGVPFLIAGCTDLLIGGWLVDKLIRLGLDASRVRQTVLAVGTTCGLAIFGAASADSPSMALLWICISLAGLAAASPVGWSIPGLIAPGESVGRVGGIMNFFSQCAAISAPIVTGFIASTGSFYWAFASAAALIVVGVLSYVLLLGRIEMIEPG